MTSKKLIFGFAALMIAGSLTLTSCHKKKKTNDPPVEDTEQGSASDNHYAETTVNDITNMGSQGSESGSASLSTYRGYGDMQAGSVLAASCATVTGNFIAKTFTVDFGTTGCNGLDGKVRTGKLIYNYSASTGSATAYRMPGFACSVTSSNYVVDGYTVNIVSKNIANTTPASIPTGTNPGTNLTWNISSNVSIIKPSGGGTITWTGSRTKTLLNTNDPNCYKGQGVAIDWTKAKIMINGSASGTNSSNESFTATSTNLIRDFNCVPDPLRPHRHPFISGVMVYTPGSRPTRTIDFGNSTCDFNATLTINGNTYSITLP